MFQVTAISHGAEIGYGEGESYEWAMNEAAEQAEAECMYPAESVMLHARKAGHVMTTETPLTLWREVSPD